MADGERARAKLEEQVVKQPLRVLLVEDSEDDALLLVRHLRRAGYAPVSERAATPAALTAALAKGAWDLVISDYRMPEFDGLAALKLVQELGSDVPFILVSGAVGEEVAVEAMKAGAHDYVLKDNLARLNSAVERELREAGIRRQHRQAEREIRDRDEELTTIYEHAPLVLLLVDREYRVRKTNRSAAHFGGAEPASLVGLRAGEALRCQHVLDDPRGCGFGPSCRDCPVRRAIHETLTTGQSQQQVEVNLVVSDGKRSRQAIGLLSTAKLIIRGEELVLVTIQNVTRLKETEAAMRRSEAALQEAVEQLNTANEELQAANEELQTANEQLLSTSRELESANEELRLVNDTLELRVEERTVELNRRLRQLRALAGRLTLAEEQERRRLAHVLHDGLQQLLVGARFHVDVVCSGVADPTLAKDLEKVIDLLTESIKVSRSLTADLCPTVLSQEGLAAAFKWLGGWFREQQGLKVDVIVQAEAVVPAEEIRIALFQSVRELLFNVVKHARVKTARVRLSQTPEGMICIEVRDRGAGFDPAQVRAREGTEGGFGLFSLRERLESFAGRLEVNSVPGRGSRFTIIAPLSTSLPDSHATTVAPPASQAPASPEIRKIRILVADDHAVIRDGLKRAFQDEPDLDVVGEAADGIEAIHEARRLRPDVVVMDVAMPKMDGIEATRRLIEEFPQVRVVGLSMSTDESHRAALHAAGAAQFLDKTHSAASVVAAIRKCIRAPRKRKRAKAVTR